MSPVPTLQSSTIELVHLQTQIAFVLPSERALTRIGKHHNQQSVDIDLSGLPDADIVSRLHVQIYCDGTNYFIEDLGSSNGSFLNGKRLQPGQSYPLSLSDRLDLGQGGKVSFVVRQQPTTDSAAMPVRSTTKELFPRQLSDKATRFLGVLMMTAGVVILASATHIGIFFSTQAILLWLAGVALLFQRRIHPDWGWLLIVLGIGVTLLSGRVFASTNLLQLLIASTLFAGGYQLYTRGNLPSLF